MKKSNRLVIFDITSINSEVLRCEKTSKMDLKLVVFGVALPS